MDCAVPARPGPVRIDLAKAKCRRRHPDSLSRFAVRCGASAASLAAFQLLRSRVQRRARPYGDRSVDAAINIGRDASRQRRQKMSDQAKKQLRIMEVKRKIQVLKGRKAAVGYSRQDDKEDKKDEADQGQMEEGEPAEGLAREEAGEAQDDWAFKRSATRANVSDPSLLDVSDNSRAIAETELYGAGGIATSRQLIDAAIEFNSIKDWDKAAELLEMVGPRISEEQLNRKLDYKEAQEFDDEATTLLASAYASSGRLTLSFNTYDELRSRLTEPKQRQRAEAGWVEVAFKIAERLQKDYRWQDCLKLLETVREVAQTRVAGEKVMEEIEMYIAMCLQKVGREDEAMEVLKSVKNTSRSRNRKAQAQFVMDVMSVDLPESRNEEFHKVWDDNFNLPKDMTRQVGAGTRRSVNLNLSTQERAFRTWASQYWEERLKSPVYYFALTLWVTWPFAIPVVSILRRSGMLEPLS